jgi:site-specific DNA recombinase
VKVWNRMDVRKHRRSGKRLPRMKPESEWKRTPVAHLQIAPNDLWAAVRARKDRNDPAPH